MYQTQILLDNIYQQTEKHLDKAVKEWQMLPAIVFEKQPKNGGWSAAQCLEHLNFYGHYYLPAIENAIEIALKKGLKPSNNFKSGWLGDYFYRLMLPNTEGVTKSKMKSPSNAEPQKQPNAQKVIAEFIEQQEKMLHLIDKARTINLGTVRVPISLTTFIKLKLGDVFLFCDAHNQRHIFQVENSLRD
jgi:DinB superfamily